MDYRLQYWVAVASSCVEESEVKSYVDATGEVLPLLLKPTRLVHMSLSGAMREKIPNI